jgi:hypothetical protein
MMISGAALLHRGLKLLPPHFFTLLYFSSTLLYFNAL